MVHSACLANIRCGWGGARRGRGAGTVGVSRRVAGAGAVVVLVCAAVLGAGGAPAWAAGACPNEAVRMESDLNPETHLPLSLQLPDCRGYELVSPPYKDGSRILGTGVAVSEDGSRFLAGSLGGFAGTESNVFNNPNAHAYEFVRGGSGWVASGLAPSPARFPVQQFTETYNASRDLTRTLWVLREPSQSIYTEDFYVREPDGVFVKVGPELPPSVSGPVAGYSNENIGVGASVVGVSSDLSRVLFVIPSPASSGNQSFLWPGDTTSGQTAEKSLYEYAGTGDSHPDLVGVSDGGTVVNSGEHPTETFAAGRLISDCGASLGGPGGLENNRESAVSADGKTVFFTPGAVSAGNEGKYCNAKNEGTGPAVSELYARIDGSETVAISEPTKAQCAKCETAPMVPDSAASFQGASEDGSKAFFLTEQKLLGTEGKALYEYDFDNVLNEKIVPISGGVVKPEVQGVARISRDGSHVYFVARAVLTNEPDLSLEAGEREAVAGADNLYVFERDGEYPQGRIAFVAMLCSEEGESGTAPDPFCHGEDQEDWAKQETRTNRVQATPDGRFLVFRSAGDLTPGDTSRRSQLFEYDASQEKLVRVSVGQRAPGVSYECPVTKALEEGYNCNGNIKKFEESPELPAGESGESDNGPSQGLAVSNDGSYVFFQSADGLAPGALNNVLINEYGEEDVYAHNVYEYHSTVAAGGSITEGNVYLISDGQDSTLETGNESGVELFGTDASGGDVFFGSGDRLVKQDTDTQLDVYDARVDGGFPAPLAPTGCEGEGCLPGASAVPLFGAAGSVTAKGGGNLTPTPPLPVPAPVTSKPKPKAKTKGCEKGFTRKHNKCVKSKSKKRAKKAGDKRGAKR